MSPFGWSLAVSLLTCTLALSCSRDEESARGSIARPGSKDEGPLPVLHSIPEFSFMNEDGEKFGSKELSGAPYLAAFMFTRCPSICPRLTKRMKEVDTAAKKAGKKLQLVSLSVDPENDSPEVLAAYAKKHGADVTNWAFLTGDFGAIAKTSEEGFKIGLSGTIDAEKPHLGITHGSHLILVDRAGRIRGYFRSSDDETVSAVIESLDRL